MPYTPLVRDLRARIGAENVLSAPSELAVYECDAFTIERRAPEAVVFPCSAEQVAAVVGVCRRHECPIVPRGAGTSLAGGCVPLHGGVVVMLTRMNRILEIRLRDRMAVVEPGVLNLQLTRALARSGYHFAPDPSSQGAATIGGNVATNAGGPHTLKYGVTVNHVLGLEAVLGDGSLVQVGPVEDASSLDLAGLLCGSEGTLGIVTKIWVRLTPNPREYRAMRAIFNTVDEATNAVSQIIAAGIIPAAMELMDQGILAAVEEAFHFGFPLDAGAVLIVEVDGPEAGIDAKQQQVAEFCRKWHARDVLLAKTAAERELLWKCRKLAVGSVGRLSPSYVIQDGVVPRTRLPHVLARVTEIGHKHQIRIVNVAHAGDGNVHPILLFDERDRQQVQRAQEAGRELLEECIACGGSITAEHGIGIEKIELMERLFAPADLRAMHHVREAFDPSGRLNPGKLLPPRESGAEGESSATPTSDPPAAEISTPAEESAVAAVLREASRARTPVYPSGGGTVRDSLDSRLNSGWPGIVLRTSQLNRILDHAAADMTITVEAGVTIAELRRQLAARQQWLPVDVPCADRATVGGAVAANTRGPRQYAHGTLRDYVLGLRAVDGRGVAFSAGGRVVKNAAGYNMPRLLVGSWGALGVITQVTLMVRPRPETSVWLSCEAGDSITAERMLAGLVDTRTLPAAIEMLAGPTYRMLVAFEGSRAEVEWMSGQLAEEWIAAGLGQPAVHDGDAADKLWNDLTEARADFEVAVLPGAAVATTARLLELAPGCSVQAHAGNGVLRIKLPPSDGDGRALRARLDEALSAVGRRSDGAAAVMHAIKERFDPAGILNPLRSAFA